MRVLFKVTNNGETIYTTCPAENKEKLKALFDECGATVEIYTYPVPLEALPNDVQDKVKSTLRAFSEVSVTYENMKFTTSAAICLSARYAYDHMVCGRYKQEEVYTKEERRQNFKEEFGYTPAYI
jgi:hypothetical protein